MKILLHLRKVAFPMLISMYIAGLIGYLTPLKSIFVSLTAFHLTFSTFLLLLHHADIEEFIKSNFRQTSPELRSFFLFSIITFLYGYVIELLGVKTGFIFGNYEYGKTLGLKLFDIPLVIGVNWLALAYLSGVCTENIGKNWHFLLKSLFSASIMLGLDFLIEPVAIKYDFWRWQGGNVPMRNYVGWLVCGFLLHLIWNKMPFLKQNRYAFYLLVIQFLFFLILNFI
jgi:uncharacterized membrane protein